MNSENEIFYMEIETPDEMDDKFSEDLPSVANSKYFTFTQPKKFAHPTNPTTNGFISSRILPDESNLLRLSTALSADFEIQKAPDISGYYRMNSPSFKEEYANMITPPTILSHGEINLNWKK
jgi:hypothetical protein